jgi:hypothetical protein
VNTATASYNGRRYPAGACSLQRRIVGAVASQLSGGAVIPARRLTTIAGHWVAVPAATGRTHLQFRRVAGCPTCNLHLHSFAQRHHGVADAGITEVVFFHSPVTTLRGYQSSLPFAAVHYERYADDQWSVDQLLGIHRLLDRKDPS